MNTSEFFVGLSDRAKVAAAWDVNKEHADNNYRTQVLDAVECGATTGQEYALYRQLWDKEILEIRLMRGEKVTKKNGDWLWSKVCKNSTYRSNMSVISKQLDAGLPLLDTDGTPVPKSIMSKMQKDKSLADAEMAEDPSSLLDKRMARMSKDLDYLNKHFRELAVSDIQELQDKVNLVEANMQDILQPF